MRFCLDLPNSFSILGQWLYNWQTLISGIFALIAASISVHFIKKQISQTEKHHQAELQRRHNAVRAIMPLALSSINSWCEFITVKYQEWSESPSELMDLERRTRDFQIETGQDILFLDFFKVEAIPNDIMNTLKDFIETLSRQDIIKNSAEMVSNIQDLTSDLAVRRFHDSESYWSGVEAFNEQATKIRELHNIIDVYCRNFDLQIIDAGHKS